MKREYVLLIIAYIIGSCMLGWMLGQATLTHGFEMIFNLILFGINFGTVIYAIINILELLQGETHVI